MLGVYNNHSHCQVLYTQNKTLKQLTKKQQLNSIFCLKDTIAVTRNMIYNFEDDDEDDDEEVPSLEEFKTQLVGQMLRSAFFKRRSKITFT